jgi:maltose-binding protein MalE
VPTPTERPASPFVVVATAMVSNYSDSKDLAQSLALTLTGHAVAEALEDAGLVPALQAPSTDVSLAAWRDVAVGGHAVPNVSEMDRVWPAWDQAVLDIVDGAPDPRRRWSTMAQDVGTALGAS